MSNAHDERMLDADVLRVILRPRSKDFSVEPYNITRISG